MDVRDLSILLRVRGQSGREGRDEKGKGEGRMRKKVGIVVESKDEQLYLFKQMT